MNPTLRAAIAAALSLLAASIAPSQGFAHQYWLSPSTYEAAPGDTIDVGAAVGTGFRGRRIPWNPERAIRLVVRGESTVDFRMAVLAGETIWTRYAPADRDGAMIAFESGFAPVELPGDEFEHYLKDEGLDEALRARRDRDAARQGEPPASSIQPVRERFRRCAKTWIAGANGERATEPFGLPLEIVPEQLPGAGTELPVRVLANGVPVANALVKAWRQSCDASGMPRNPESRDSTGTAWSGRTDAEGRVVVPTAKDGEWLVSAVRMVPCSDEWAAEWESTWGSLTFERRELPRTLRFDSASRSEARSRLPIPR